MKISSLFELFNGNTICRLIVNHEQGRLRSLFNAKTFYPNLNVENLDISIENGLPILNIYVTEE